MDRFLTLTFAGLTQASIIALIALGFLVIYKATGVINFAQGDMVTLGAYLALWAWPGPAPHARGPPTSSRSARCSCSGW